MVNEISKVPLFSSYAEVSFYLHAHSIGSNQTQSYVPWSHITDCFAKAISQRKNVRHLTWIWPFGRLKWQVPCDTDIF